MELYKNGYVVAKLNADGKAYDSWPLSDMLNDKIAEYLTDKADDEWFCKYDMQHIAPDLDYAKKYLEYCEKINLPVKLLLFESPDDTITVNDAVEIVDTLGYDCIATVYYSYLQTESDDLKSGIFNKKIYLNKYGLADSLEDVLNFIKERRKIIDSGGELEDFWEETPVKISVVV